MLTLCAVTEDVMVCSISVFHFPTKIYVVDYVFRQSDLLYWGFLSHEDISRNGHR